MVIVWNLKHSFKCFLIILAHCIRCSMQRRVSPWHLTHRSRGASSGAGGGGGGGARLAELEEEQEELTHSLMALTSHFAQVGLEGRMGSISSLCSIDLYY